MSNSVTSNTCETDIDQDEAPPISEADWSRAVHRVGLRPVTGTKVDITIALDADVLSWLKRQAGDEECQTLINAKLRESMQQLTLEETLRRVIRDELRADQKRTG